VGNKKLQELIEERAKAYYAKDAEAPARWEPDGADFLSPSLCEADLMRRVLPPDEFRTWFHSTCREPQRGNPQLYLVRRLSRTAPIPSSCTSTV
jgi:hypothetical protein